MERKAPSRQVEDRTLSRVSIANFLSQLSPQELEVLWFLAVPGNTVYHISVYTELSASQVTTIRAHLAQKAAGCLLQ